MKERRKRGERRPEEERRGEERRGERRPEEAGGREERREEAGRGSKKRGEGRKGEEEAEGREEEEAVMAGINCFRSSLQITLAPRVASFFAMWFNEYNHYHSYMYAFFDLKDSITLSSLQRLA